MPDIVTLHAGDPAGTGSGRGGGLYQSKRYISFKVHNGSGGGSGDPKPQLQPVRSGRTHQFSYNKNWGEVSNTLRKKLSERLSALKESDDNSGDDDRHYRSESEFASRAASLASRDRTPESADSREKSPVSPRGAGVGREAEAGASGDTHPTNAAGGVASRYLFGANGNGVGAGGASSGSSLAAVTASVSAAARLNRTGTAFQGMQVSLSPRASRPGTPKRALSSSPAGRAETPEREPVPRVVSSLAGARSITPERGDYRSLASLLIRSGTPERGSLRKVASGGSQRAGGSRSSTPGTPDRRSVSPEKAPGATAAMDSREVDEDHEEMMARQKPDSGERTSSRRKSKTLRESQTVTCREGSTSPHDVDISNRNELGPEPGVSNSRHRNSSLNRNGKELGGARMKSYQDSGIPKQDNASQGLEGPMSTSETAPTKTYQYGDESNSPPVFGNSLKKDKRSLSREGSTSPRDIGSLKRSGDHLSRESSTSPSNVDGLQTSGGPSREGSRSSRDTSSLSRGSVRSSREESNSPPAGSLRRKQSADVSEKKDNIGNAGSMRKPRAKTPPADYSDTGSLRKPRAKTPQVDHETTGGSLKKPRAKTPPIDYSDVESLRKPRAKTPPADYDENNDSKIVTDEGEERKTHNGQSEHSRGPSPLTNVWASGATVGYISKQKTTVSEADGKTDSSSNWVNYLSNGTGIDSVSEQPDSWENNVSDVEMTLNDSLEDCSLPLKSAAPSSGASQPVTEEPKPDYPTGADHSEGDENEEDIYALPVASPSAVLPLIPRVSSAIRGDYGVPADTSHQRHPKPLAVTHFVEVTSIEDGQRRITYVENGVTVEPVLPRKNRGTFTRKTRRVRQPEVIQEADEETDEGAGGESACAENKSEVDQPLICRFPDRKPSPVGSGKPRAPSPSPCDSPTVVESDAEEDEKAVQDGVTAGHVSGLGTDERAVVEELSVSIDESEEGTEEVVDKTTEEMARGKTPKATQDANSEIRQKMAQGLAPAISEANVSETTPETKHDEFPALKTCSPPASPTRTESSYPHNVGSSSDDNLSSSCPPPQMDLSSSSLTPQENHPSTSHRSSPPPHSTSNGHETSAEPATQHDEETEPEVRPRSSASISRFAPGPGTGAVPKQRNWRDTQVVKFPKDRSRGRAAGRVSSDQMRYFGDSSDYEPIAAPSDSPSSVSASSQTASGAAAAAELTSSVAPPRPPAPTSSPDPAPAGDSAGSDGTRAPSRPPAPSPAPPPAPGALLTAPRPPAPSPPPPSNVASVSPAPDPVRSLTPSPAPAPSPAPSNGPNVRSPTRSPPPPIPAHVPVSSSASERREKPPRRQRLPPSDTEPAVVRTADRSTNTPSPPPPPPTPPHKVHQIQQTPPPQTNAVDSVVEADSEDTIYGVLPVSAAHHAAVTTATVTATIAAAAAVAATAAGATPAVATAAATAAAVAATAVSPAPSRTGQASTTAPPTDPPESARPRLDAEIPLGSVALKQALYESISEERGGRRAQDLPGALPCMIPGKWIRPADDDSAAEQETEETEETEETQETRGSQETQTDTAEEQKGDEEEKPRRERVFRIRRSALEALRYRIPQLRDVVRTRFKSNEISITNGNGHHAAAVGPESPESADPWSERPLDDVRVEAESDSELSNHSPAGGEPANHSPAADAKPAQDDGKHSLLQYAMLHFRDAEEKYNMLRSEDGEITGSIKVEKKKGKKKGKEDWTWREQVEMVKWTNQPLQASLLKLESGDRASSHMKLEAGEMNKQALDCFLSIQRYMGDQPMAKDISEVDCVYTILMACHRAVPLRDEVYCQLMRQTTSNKSAQPDSCQRGWRLFSIVAAYFTCSDGLRPYLFKYLETAAYDKRRAYHGTAMVCLQNLRKTFRFGGRKNVPSIEEITAITAGRNSKRQIYRLPGGTERVINTKSTSVVQDIIEDICSVIKIRSREEMEEFSLYCIVEGDTFTMPLAREEYILDVTTELQKNEQIFYLIFCRSVWYFPLRLESPLYVEVVFNQIAPDYLEGLLLVMPGETLHEEVVYDISRVAALLHRAADMKAMPTMKETKYLLPKAALMVRDIKPPQWVNMVQDSWTEVQQRTPMEAKAAVLEILERWPLFGSSFFAVSRVTESREAVDHILALNRGGVHFLDSVTHETLARYPFSEVISTRKVKTEEGTLFLDMKYGNLMQQKVVRIQSDNAHEISRLIRQYISIEQKHRPSNSKAAAAEDGREGQASR